jgi:hypothetical protein
MIAAPILVESEAPFVALRPFIRMGIVADSKEEIAAK